MDDKITIEEITEKPWTYNDIEYWINPKDNVCNAIIIYKEKRTRLRASILIVKNDEVLLGEEANEPGKFSIPGGSIDINETPIEAATREAREEVFVNVKNAREAGYDYCECHTKVVDWVKKHIPESKQWYHYYTNLIIADYDSEYTGKVANADLDPTMNKTSKWYKINEVINLPAFNAQWKKALINFGYAKTPITEAIATVDPETITDEIILNDLINTFGLLTKSTWTRSTAFYILKSGEILNTQDMHGLFDKAQHQNIAEYIDKKYKGYKGRTTDVDRSFNNSGSIFMAKDCKAVRITPWLKTITVPDEITTAQYRGIIDFLEQSEACAFAEQKKYIDLPITIAIYSDKQSPMAKSTNTSQYQDLIEFWPDPEVQPDYAIFDEAYESLELFKNTKQLRYLNKFRPILNQYRARPTAAELGLLKKLSESIYSNKAKETFGITNKFNKAGYILADGTLLDFSEGQSVRTLDHRDISIIYQDENLDSSSEAMVKFMIEENAIRFMPEMPGICLIKEPTEKQYVALNRLIELNYLDDLIVDVWDSTGNSSKAYFCIPLESSNIIISLKRYFATGIIPKTWLTEDTRTALIGKSRNAGPYKDKSRGKNRFERKKWSKVANTVKQYNKIDMNDLFKKDILLIKIPVTGETDSYTVSIKMEGVMTEIAKNVKTNNNKFEFRTVIQALTKVFNSANVYVNCTCPDHTYNFAHWAIVNNYSTEDTSKDPGPGKGIANPNNNKGTACKHSLLVLANGDWLMKVASVINNYVHYAEEHLQKPFLNIIFPKIYGIPADEMVDQNLIDDDKYLDSSTGLIDAINEYGRNRGRYRPGSNKNPVTGSGGRLRKQ